MNSKNAQLRRLLTSCFPKMRGMPVGIALLSGLIFAPGCSFAPHPADLTPDYAIPDQFINAPEQQAVEIISSESWWESYDDANLNRIIDSLLVRNLDLQIALSRVKQVQANLKHARSQLWPALNIDGTASDSKSIFMMGDMIIENENTDYSLAAGLSWELDIWGRVRNLKDAAVADLRSAQYDLTGFYQALIAQAVALYFDVSVLMKRVELIEFNSQLYTLEYTLLQDRYTLGVGRKADMIQAEQRLAGGEAQLARERQLLEFSRHQLALLLGIYPGDVENLEISKLPDLAEIPAVPVGIPSSLLEKRSDIRSAEYKVEAARKKVGAARADLLPRITLFGNSGYRSKTLEDLFDDTARTHSMGGSASGIIDWGGKRAAVRQNQESYNQAILSYQQTVLNAFREVEDALVLVRESGTQAEQSRRQVRLADTYLTIQEGRYEQGLSPYNQWINAARGWVNAEYSAIQSELSALQSRINLHLALGGDWLDSRSG